MTKLKNNLNNMCDNQENKKELEKFQSLVDRISFCLNELDDEASDYINVPGSLLPVKHSPCVAMFQHIAAELPELAQKYNELLHQLKKRGNEEVKGYGTVDMHELCHTVDKEVALLSDLDKPKEKNKKHHDDKVTNEMNKVIQRLKRNLISVINITAKDDKTQTIGNGIPADMDGMPDCDGSNAL